MYLRLLVVLVRAKLRGRGSALGPNRVPLRVRPSDLDPLGHMNNGVYFSIFDLGRIELMVRSGIWKRFRERDWYGVVTAETGTFRRELRPFRRFDLHTELLGWDERHLYFQHRITSGGKLCTHAVIQLRFLSKDGAKVGPDELLATLPEPPERPELPTWVSEWSRSSYEHARSLEGTRPSSRV
jgi:acyl-CoA thioesterase FadM